MAVRSGSATMRPRARLIGLIGDELISDEPVAVVELVKNAYDADATKVTVEFVSSETSRPAHIVISDNGLGMDVETVLGSWFEPGTVTKRKSETSPGGRRYQGAKGIGRFASARLASSLLLESRKRDSEAVLVLINWGSFDDESYLDQVSIEYEVGIELELKHGTRLTLENVRTDWCDDDFQELHTRLSRLISPFKDISDFAINLIIPERSDLSGYVTPPEVTLTPKYALTGELDRAGLFTGQITIDGHVGRVFSSTKLGGQNATPACGPFAVEIRGWDRDRPGLDPIIEKTGAGIQEIRRTLNAYCGVSIYRDGFRVHPYGEAGNDWLNLDIRSRLTPGQKMANNQLIAAIQLTRDDNPDLRDRSNREGLVLNEAYSNLRVWFAEILSLLEQDRYRSRRQEVPEDKTLFQNPTKLFNYERLSATTKRAQLELGRDNALVQDLNAAEAEVRDSFDRIQSVFSRLLMSAGVGHTVDVVLHEIGAPLGKIIRQITILEKALHPHLQENARTLMAEKIQPMRAWLEQIRSLRERLDPQTAGKRGRSSTFDVYDEVHDNFSLYEALIKRQKIEYNILRTGAPLAVTMSRASLGQVMANLIDNSIFWITRHYGSGNGGKILVQVETLEHGFRILFSDNGPGIPEENRDMIFEPYFTGKPDGMGLGLYISRLILEAYGSLSYSDECALPGACFEARFEHGVGR